MTYRLIAASTVACAGLVVTGCHKRVAIAPPPPPAPMHQQTPATTARSEGYTAPRETRQEPTQTASNMPNAETRARIQDLLDRIQDAYFDYDKHDIRPDAQKALVEDAHTLTDILKQYPNYKLTVEGFCDDRGSEEYNMALGDARAKQAKEYLVSLGIPADQLRTVSYGKDKPVCTEDSENCWQKNRRAHITQDQS